MSRATKLIAVEVPENAQHVAQVGQAVRESDAVRWGIRVRSEFVDGETPGAFVGAPARRVPMTKAPGADSPRLGFGIASAIPADTMYGGCYITETDPIVERQRDAEALDVEITTRKGRRHVVVTGVADGCEVRVEMTASTDYDGVDAYSLPARHKVERAAARAWTAAMRGV